MEVICNVAPKSEVSSTLLFMKYAISIVVGRFVTIVLQEYIHIATLLTLSKGCGGGGVCGSGLMAAREQLADMLRVLPVRVW